MSAWVKGDAGFCYSADKMTVYTWNLGSPADYRIDAEATLRRHQEVESSRADLGGIADGVVVECPERGPYSGVVSNALAAAATNDGAPIRATIDEASMMWVPATYGQLVLVVRKA